MMGLSPWLSIGPLHTCTCSHENSQISHIPSVCTLSSRSLLVEKITAGGEGSLGPVSYRHHHLLEGNARHVPAGENPCEPRPAFRVHQDFSFGVGGQDIDEEAGIGLYPYLDENAFNVCTAFESVIVAGSDIKMCT